MSFMLCKKYVMFSTTIYTRVKAIRGKKKHYVIIIAVYPLRVGALMVYYLCSLCATLISSGSSLGKTYLGMQPPILLQYVVFFLASVSVYDHLSGMNVMELSLNKPF